MNHGVLDIKHMEHVNITIIGGGAIGLAIAAELGKTHKNILVLERHATFGQETSARNSEVIHAGLYYPPDSLKAKLCVRGRKSLYEYCVQKKIRHKKLGKLLVATDDKEGARLHEIYKNAAASGVTECRYLSKSEIAALEPDIAVKEAFFSPGSGILDTHGFMKALYDDACGCGVEFAFGIEVTGLALTTAGYIVSAREPDGSIFEFKSEIVVNAAGLCADAVAALTGIDIDEGQYRLHYCKGQYFRIADPARYSIRHLIYPPPTEASLGIHITPDLGGGLRLGPDAAYVSAIDYAVDSTSRDAFYHSVRTFLPQLSKEELIEDTAGIRPKLQPEGEAFRDFVIADEADKGFPRFIDLIGIESPGLTAALAIAEYVHQLIKE